MVSRDDARHRNLFFAQIPNGESGCLSYLVGDRRARECAAIDPLADQAPLMALASEEGLRITAVLETHHHDDHVSGAAALAARTQAQLHLPAWSPHQPPETKALHHDTIVSVGTLRLRVIATPGHTKGAVCLYLEHHDKLLSGDTLLVGSVGAPADQATGLTELFRSVTVTLMALPDHVEVYPGHYGPHHGLPEQRVTTIGEQRISNPALDCNDPEELLYAFAAHWSTGGSGGLKLD